MKFLNRAGEAGITQNGLFWTSIVSDDHVAVDLDSGRAIMEVRDLHMKDYFDVVSAPIGTSTTDGAELGTERNGAFY